MKKIRFIGKSYGRSMTPLINPGDNLFIKKVKKEDISIGDIVVFYNEKKCISHRVLYKKENALLVKGDNVPFADKLINPSEILGKIAKIEGKYGVIYLEGRVSRLIQCYFLFRSAILLHSPFFLYGHLSRLLRGRRFLTKWISKNRKLSP